MDYIIYKRASSLKCCISDCKSTRQDLVKRSYFSFPKDPTKCDTWIKKCGVDRLKKVDPSFLNRNYRLCSLHFENKMFLNFQKNRLKSDAVPTLFGDLIEKTSTPNDSECQLNDDKSFINNCPPSCVKPVVLSDIKSIPYSSITLTSNKNALAFKIWTDETPCKNNLRVQLKEDINNIKPFKKSVVNLKNIINLDHSYGIQEPQIQDIINRDHNYYSVQKPKVLNNIEDKNSVVVTCAAVLCDNQKSHQQKAVSFFRFPNVVTESNKWVSLIGRNDLIDRDLSELRICSAHFDESYITSTHGDQPQTQLINGAVPVKNLMITNIPNNKKCENKTSISKVHSVNDKQLLNKSEEIYDVPHKDLECKSTSLLTTKDTECKNCFKSQSDSSTQVSTHPLFGKSRKHKLNKYVQTTDERYNNLLAKYNKLKASTHKNEPPTIHDFHNMCDLFLKPDLAQFVKFQPLIHVKSKNGLRYPNSYKQFALKLHFLSPKGYRFVRKFWNLPCIRTLQRETKKDKN